MKSKVRLLELGMTHSLELFVILRKQNYRYRPANNLSSWQPNTAHHPTSNWEKKFTMTNLHKTMWRKSVITIPSSEREQPISVIYSNACLCSSCSCKEFIYVSFDHQWQRNSVPTTQANASFPVILTNVLPKYRYLKS